MTPTPAHAITIWLGSSRAGAPPTIFCAIPPTTTDAGHTLTIPADAKGVDVLLSLLRARVMLKPTDRIGTPSVPLQAMIDALRTSTKQPHRQELTIEDLDDI